MKLEDHENSCIEKLGMPFTEIHKYLDQYFPIFRNGNHRAILHHHKGIDKIVRRFADNYGYEGQILVRQAAELHVIDDMGVVLFEPCDFEQHLLFLNGAEEREWEHCLSLEFS